MAKRKVLIMGAAGRDFHNFNVYYRNNPNYEVVAFTAFQIPGIAGRKYPASLAGKLYPKGIPIFDESELVSLIKKHSVDDVVFAYSDVNFNTMMQKGSLVLANGATFSMLPADKTMIESRKPVIAVCAVRTGCGKSQTSRAIAAILKAMGKKVVVIRHPMPYGDLEKQRCQRFASLEDMKKHGCTIEEMEEYEPHIAAGHVVYAGVDYADILRSAEKEADVILWDGGNNDTPFYKPDLHIVVADPLRPGHEELYHPGMTNIFMADVVILNKVDTAKMEMVQAVRDNVRRLNPKAVIIEAESPVTLDDKTVKVAGKKVLVVEDGPTLTHGEMGFGAAYIAAKQYKAGKIIDPRPWAVGSIKGVYEKYSHLRYILPAMGYGEKQMSELKKTINAIPCDLVLVGTPIDLARHLNLTKPSVRIGYSLKERPGSVSLKTLVKKALK
ncbi:MAG: GTPase [Elusimicrobia bacterium]|nr:GTPase [Elusimicrobiota bacterium]